MRDIHRWPRIAEEPTTGVKMRDILTSQTHLRSKFKVIFVDDSRYQAWTAQVRALKPNKRKNWKDTLINQKGDGTRVCYNEASGHFENYSPARETSMMKKYAPWVRVVPSSSGWCAKAIPTTRAGAAYIVSDEVGQRISRRSSRTTIRATTGPGTTPSRCHRAR